jgi:ribonuclease BN (tRNA processing enzyme)
MSNAKEPYQQRWMNDETEVFVPFSAAGVSTTIEVTSKLAGKTMLLDVGDGALRDLLFAHQGTSWIHEIDIIALTHGHFDHMGGLHSLLGFLRLFKRTHPLNILVPANCTEAIGTVANFRRYYSSTLPFRIDMHEMRDGSGFNTGFFRVQAIAVEHSELEFGNGTELVPALGFRVSIGPTVVAYTGDTRWCKGAEEVVRHADLAIIEATKREPPTEGARVHLTEGEAQELASLAKESLLVHRIPTLKDS